MSDVFDEYRDHERAGRRHGHPAPLLLGPLYHLTDRDDRLLALREARRVTRPGGPVLVAAIARYSIALDGYFHGLIDRPGFLSMMRTDLDSGQHRNPNNEPDPTYAND